MASTDGPLTPLQGALPAALAEIRKRAAKASPGPWEAATELGVDTDGNSWGVPHAQGPDGNTVLYGSIGDLRFAAHARTDVPRLLAALEAVLKGHDPVQLYGSADDCGHSRPYEPDREDFEHFGREADQKQAEFDAWDEEHPFGSPVSEGGGDPGRICLGRPQELICPACSKARYGDGYDFDGAYVDAGDCLIRPAITRALAGTGIADQQAEAADGRL